MIEIFITIILILALSVVGVFLIGRRYRGETDVYNLAQKLVIEKLSLREELKMDSLFKELNLSAQQQITAETILEKIAYIIQIPPGKLRLNDNFESILSIQKNELEYTLQEKWEDNRLPEYIEVHTHDLLDFFYRTTI